MNKYSAQVAQEVKMFSLHNSRAFLLLLLLVVFGKFDGTCYNILCYNSNFSIKFGRCKYLDVIQSSIKNTTNFLLNLRNTKRGHLDSSHGANKFSFFLSLK